MVRPLAFYLPQFHPIPENDVWWGKGFTEWTNTAKAMPLFKGHYQPHVPADLGFYDLRLPETRAAQADMARAYGIEGFCYYHYWFGDGRRILERPFNEVLATGKPDFPFCLCWANQSWTGHWHGAPKRMLIEQTYPGELDYRAHFAWLLRAFRDPRYLTVDGAPLLLVFLPNELPDARGLCRLWRDLAEKAGLPGLHLLAMIHNGHETDHRSLGFDGTIDCRMPLGAGSFNHDPGPQIVDHRVLTKVEVGENRPGDARYPCVGPTWDNTPRLGRRGTVFAHSSPDLFRDTIGRAAAALKDRPASQQLLFVKAWNEWAEGNHLEPDLKYGHGWLRALRGGLTDAATD